MDQPLAERFSFPQFKYLLYTHSDKLPLNAQLRLTPAMQLTLEWHANADARFPYCCAP